MGIEPSGFDAFVASRHHALVRTAFLLVGDHGRAEDLMQTALYETFTHWDRLRSTDAVEAYTRTTMVRLSGRWGRRRWRGERPDPHAGGMTSSPDVADALAVDVHEALGRLPAGQRAALVLRLFDDLSEAETAAILRCSPGTVKSRVSRGLAGLRADGLLTGVPAAGPRARRTPADEFPTEEAHRG